jgi:hypothetical protein
MSTAPRTDAQPSRTAHFDEGLAAVVVEQLRINDKDVVREAQRWTTGDRGGLVEDPGVLGAADLSSFVTEAVRIGAHALSVTGQAQETRALERMLKDVGDKTAASTTEAAEVTGRALKEASDVMAKAASDARKAITEADAQSRKEFTTAVATAKGDLSTEVRRLFGGDSPELLERLTPLLDRFGADLDVKVRESTETLLTKTAKQFDPADPSSPMARHTAELGSRHEALTRQLEKQHGELADKVDELTVALKLQQARTTLVNVTPIKGGSFEDQVHELMHTIAAGLGDEYAATGAIVGRLSRCKKGDGLLTAGDGSARVVLEMTDSPRTGWGDYFDEAERNRDASAALGLVRSVEQNAGLSLRVLGTRRIVMAFDPEQDDPELLRTVVMLLRTAAIAASSRTGAAEIATAEEKIGEALEQLATLDDIKKLAGLILTHATKIDAQSAGLSTGIQRLLGQALEALAGAGSAGTSDGSSSAVPGAVGAA